MALGNPLEAPLRSGKDTGEGGDGGGVAGVSSFKGRTGAVVPQNGDYNASQITETALSKLMTAAERAKLAGIEDGATGDQTGPEIETAYNAQVAQVSGAERTAGTATAIRRFSPADIATMAGIHGGGGVGGAAEPVTWYTTAYDTTIPAGETRAVPVAAAGAVPGTHVGQYVDLPANPQPELLKWSAITANDQITVSIRNTGTTPILVEDVAASYTSSSIANAQDAVVAAQVVATVADLATARSTYVRAEGYYSFNDGGEGLFKAIESGAAVDGGHVFAATALGGAWRYHRCGVQKRAVHVAHFGYRNDNVSGNDTVNTAAVQAALDYLSALGQTDYQLGNSLIFPPGIGHINDELVVQSHIGAIHVICFSGRARIIQRNADTLGAPIFKFTIDPLPGDVLTPGRNDKHRHVAFFNISMEYATAQAATKTRAICVAWTNYPANAIDANIGSIYGIDFVNCHFINYFRGVAPIPPGQTDASNLNDFVQSQQWHRCYAYGGSGSLSYSNTSASGSPQWTVKDSKFQFEALTEYAFYCQGPLGLTLENCEFLKGSGVGILYAGSCRWTEINGLMVEDWDMPAGGTLVQFNSGIGPARVGNAYHINSIIGGDTVMFRVWNATAFFDGVYRVDGITHNASAKHAICAVQAGGTGACGWNGKHSVDAGDNVTKFVTLDTVAFNPAVAKSTIVSPITQG